MWLDFEGTADRLRRWTAAALERGAVEDRGVARYLAGAWDAGARRHLARSLPRPVGARIIGIGSATLGGAGKTPLCIAVARALATRGRRVAVISHGYRSDVGSARIVHPVDPVRSVGDDALFCARSFRGQADILCVSGPERHASIALASSLGAEILVVDGLLQASPRIDWSVLVVDVDVGLGAGAPPPVGDLRAFPASLFDASDTVAIACDADHHAAAPPPRNLRVPLPSAWVYSRLVGARDDEGRVRSPADLRQLRLGLLVGIAHPERVTRALARRGIVARPVIELSDHAFLPARALEQRVARELALAGHPPVDAFLTTARCAGNLPGFIAGRPVWPLEQELDPGPLLARGPPGIVQRIETPGRPYYAARP